MNILFVFADDWGRYASSYAPYEHKGTVNELISTPHFDRVAREGALFTNALVPAPSCTPCRSAVLSGKYFWQTGMGAICGGAKWDESIPTYPLELEKKGYHVGFSYKVWSPGENIDAPYGGKRNSYTPTEDPFGLFGEFSQNVSKRVDELGVEKAKEEILDEVRQGFGKFLNEREENQPFCFWLGPTNTHRTWEKGSGKKLWGLEPDDFKGRLPKFLPDVHEVREDFCDYIGESQAVDAALGAVMKQLEEIGELDNTLIVVSGDHGIPGMPRGKCNLYDIGCEVALAMRYPAEIKAGTVVNELINIMDLAPTFLEFTGVDIPETMTANSLKQLVTTGKDDVDRDYIITGRERHVSVARQGNLPYPQRAIRTKEYLYIVNFEPGRWPMGDPKGTNIKGAVLPDYEVLENVNRIAYADLDASPTKAWMIYHQWDDEHMEELFDLGFGKRPKEELYDLSKDKDLMVNLSDNPEYKHIKNSLASKLMEKLVEQNDPRIVEQPCRFESLPYTRP